MVQVNLAHHIELKRGTPEERWFDAGLQNVTEEDAEKLRGLDGVTFPDEGEPVEAGGATVRTAGIPAFDFPKVARGADAEAMDKELAAHIAEYYPNAPAPPSEPVSAQVFTSKSEDLPTLNIPEVALTSTSKPKRGVTE